MKTYKLKVIDIKSKSAHFKLIFQWIRGSDAEVTLRVVKGPYKFFSGFFAIEPTRRKAIKTLQSICTRYLNASLPIPWDNLLKKLSEKESDGSKQQKMD